MFTRPESTHRGRPRRHDVSIVLVIVLGFVGGLAAAGCYPEYRGTPPIAPYSGLAQKRVLLIGDSLMNQTAAPLAASLSAHGLQATVINRSRGGTAVAGETSGFDWVRDLPAILDSTHPDLVIVHFIGHGADAAHPYSSPGWAPWMQASSVELVDLVSSRGIPIYWVVPPVAAFFCTWQLTGWIYQTMATWYRSGLVAQRPEVKLVDWRTPISPGETRAQWLRFGAQGYKAVRPGDCLHLTALGASIAADATVAAIRAEWDRVLPTTTTSSSTTTTTELPTTTTTEGP